MKRYHYLLDLIDDPVLIAEYDGWHASHSIWPEITGSILESEILSMEIFRAGNRLFMVMETTDQFDPALKAEKDAGNSKVQEWEQLMWNYQQALPWAKPGEKWILLNRIFSLH